MKLLYVSLHCMHLPLYSMLACTPPPLCLRRSYDRDNIPAGRLRIVRQAIAAGRIDPERVRTVSTAALSLCMWARAIENYTRVAADVKPK